ncbi:TIR domain-containing protein [Mesorhizobium sp. WSM4935]|uniref:SEFIR domain-containing protein n=1 Tax=Mesorhizobium sp. WSM4935 TaxID=3038547 RepID=UPI002414EE76|nr:SEFIR domain-containing protein [Mesorhizobium sp. WSM4935]MDG4876182.1 TIR domain-containing protein [Mesorhizobium sp. WSM4935]
MTSPKAFISYSWTNQTHQKTVLEWSERLLGDGVDIIIDQFDLKEGQDKYAFMEKMVADDSVTHVLVICDRAYAEKADQRKSGVGTESQIISSEVYNKVDQSKFIPVVCEFGDDGEPFLPAFMKSRIWIDFSSAEAVNENWERLVRLLFGKPANQKPRLGNAPAYVRENSSLPASPSLGKLSNLRQAILSGKPGLGLYRNDFLDSCIEYSDALRTRSEPNLQALGQKILDDFNSLKHVRNHIIDWVLLETSSGPNSGFLDSLHDFMERLIEQKSRPKEITQWNESWFDAHGLFVYECFLYIIAALLRSKSYNQLNKILSLRYMPAETMQNRSDPLVTFEVFNSFSEILNSVFAPEGRRFLSPSAELVKRSANRKDITFDALMEADAVVFFVALLSEEIEWYPQTLLYADRYKAFPIFLRATQHSAFGNIASISGVSDAENMRVRVREGLKRMATSSWHDFRFNRDFPAMMNLDGLDTAK